MADWWDKAPLSKQGGVASSAEWWEAAPEAKKRNDKPFNVLPLSRDENGNLQFDSNAGIIGGIKNALMLPGDVAAGRVDPRSDEGIGRAAGLAQLAAGAPPVGRGASIMLSQKKPKPPTAAALFDAADEGYKTARGMGVDYSPKAVQDLAGALREGLFNEGIHDLPGAAAQAPKTFGLLDALSHPPNGAVAVPLSALESARRGLSRTTKDHRGTTEETAAANALRSLDEFMSRPPEGAVVAGPGDAAANVLRDARGNYAAGMRSDRITNLEESADLKAASAHSGRNGDNSIRQTVRPIVDPAKPKNAVGYSDAELNALREVVQGTPTRNSLRYVGNLLGGGGGLGQMLTIAGSAAAGGSTHGAAGAGLGAIAPLAVGVTSKSIADALARRALHKADDLIRQRSPLYEEMLANQGPAQFLSPQTQSALARALMMRNTAPQE